MHDMTIRSPSRSNVCSRRHALYARLRSDSHGPALSIIIVSYNCFSLLRTCLDSLPGGTGSLSYEVIVVDNNSQDRTVEKLAREFPATRVTSNSSNLGFTKACNQGMLAGTGKYLLLLNPDTIAGEESLAMTHAYMERVPDLAAAGCKVVRPDGSIDPSCKRGFPSPWNAFCKVAGLSKMFPCSRRFAAYDTGYLDANSRQEVPLIDGCYMMIRREALHEIGLFDESFFMYWAEADWCRRAISKGWSIGYDPTATITHIKGEITRHSTFRMLYHFHSEIGFYYRKHLGRWHPLHLILYPAIAMRLTFLVVWNLLRKDRRISG